MLSVKRYADYNSSNKSLVKRLYLFSELHPNENLCLY